MAFGLGQKREGDAWAPTFPARTARLCHDHPQPRGGARPSPVSPPLPAPSPQVNY